MDLNVQIKKTWKFLTRTHFFWYRSFYSEKQSKGTLLRAGGALKVWTKHRITGIWPIRPRVKLVLLFSESFCGSATRISAKCVMAFRICRKSTCFVERKKKKKRRRDRTQEATWLRLVPKKCQCALPHTVERCSSLKISPYSWSIFHSIMCSTFQQFSALTHPTSCLFCVMHTFSHCVK